MHPCPGCGTLFESAEGPTHRYIGASAGCWGIYSAIVAGQEVPAELLRASRIAPEARTRPSGRQQHDASIGTLIVDAYAAQHHGDPSPQAIQSVAVHLLAMHGVIAAGLAPVQAMWVRRRAVRRKGVYAWLTPPALAQMLTIRHLFPGGGVETPASPAEYVSSVYAAWMRLHGATIEEWFTTFVVAG